MHRGDWNWPGDPWLIIYWLWYWDTGACSSECLVSEPRIRGIDQREIGEPWEVES